MSSPADNDLSDLFGEQLAQSDDPGTPAAFRDGIYVITATGMKKGIYKSGKWVGKPYARFVYELQDGSVKRQVSQMLPWFPGKAFFEINFQKLCGMRLSEFNEHCRRENLNDAKAQSRFFLTLFRGIQYRAEVRQRGDWLNVWELKERIGHPEELPLQEEPATQTEQPSLQIEAVPTPEEWIKSACSRFSLSEDQFQTVCREEFGVPAEQLSQTDRQTLTALLEERSNLS